MLRRSRVYPVSQHHIAMGVHHDNQMYGDVGACYVTMGVGWGCGGGGGGNGSACCQVSSFFSWRQRP